MKMESYLPVKQGYSWVITQHTRGLCHLLQGIQTWKSACSFKEFNSPQGFSLTLLLLPDYNPNTQLSSPKGTTLHTHEETILEGDTGQYIIINIIYIPKYNISFLLIYETKTQVHKLLMTHCLALSVLRSSRDTLTGQAHLPIPLPLC